MSLNVKKMKQAPNPNRVDQAAMDAGTYPCRVVQVIDLGIQPQRAYKGEPKPPAHQIMITYEFTDEFCVDKDGAEDVTKPRWLSEEMPVHNLEAELAKSTKRYKAIDPALTHEGDFALLVGMPCNVTVTATEGGGQYAGRVFNNIANVSTMRPRDAANTAELVNAPKVFDTSEPDLEMFRSLPQWLQDKVLANLEYRGSALESLINGTPPAPSAPAPNVSPASHMGSDDDSTDEVGDDTPW